jgi:hypothetical protein
MSSDLGPPSFLQFSIARVLKDTARVLKANLLGCVVVTVAHVVFWYLPFTLADRSSGDGFSWWNFVVGELVGVVGWGLANAILIHLALLTLMGSRPSLRDLPRGLSVALPVIAVLAICNLPSTLARLVGAAETSGMPNLAPQIAITLVAYIVGAFLFVAGPVVVAEGLGPLVALKRSVALTAGSRWRVFGLLFVIGIAFWALQWAVWVIGTALNAQVGHTGPNLVFWIGDFVFPALQFIVWSVAQTVAYATLRFARESGSVQDLAQVFD